MPPAPDSGGRKHAPATAHVAERALARAVGPAAWDAWDTRDGAAGAPRLGGGLVAGFAGNGVGLAGVFANVGVDEVDDVWTDGGFHDGGEGEGGVGGHVGVEGLDGDERSSGRHCCVIELQAGARVWGKR
ncbi:hypothetical protein Hanom_Chr06g00567091 [Helianthus anomalus]